MRPLSLLLSPLLWWLLSRLNPGINTHSRKTLLAKKEVTKWNLGEVDGKDAHLGFAYDYPIHPQKCDECGDISLVWIGREGNDHWIGKHWKDRVMRFNYWNSDVQQDSVCHSCFIKACGKYSFNHGHPFPNDNHWKQGRIELTRAGTVNIYRHNQDVLSIDLDSHRLS